MSGPQHKIYSTTVGGAPGMPPLTLSGFPLPLAEHAPAVILPVQAVLGAQL